MHEPYKTSSIETVKPVFEDKVEQKEEIHASESLAQEEKEEPSVETGRTPEEVKAYQELVRPVQPTLNGSEKVKFSQNIAISNVPTGLSEEEATRLETHLMEMNPNLSHGQAYFYARHCTIGMSYTVDQYKKYVGCAYETARSSMNNLVLLGYYKKDKEEKPDENTIAKENLSRYLEEVDNPETQKQFDEYNQENKDK